MIVIIIIIRIFKIVVIKIIIIMIRRTITATKMKFNNLMPCLEEQLLEHF